MLKVALVQGALQRARRALNATSLEPSFGYAMDASLVPTMSDEKRTTRPNQCEKNAKLTLNDASCVVASGELGL